MTTNKSKWDMPYILFKLLIYNKIHTYDKQLKNRRNLIPYITYHFINQIIKQGITLKKKLL